AIASEARFDFHAPMGALPRWLRRARGAFPVRGTRLVPDLAQVGKWRERLEALPGRKLGWCWRSGLVTPARRRYYPPLASWLPLFGLPGISWINLQYDDCDEELDQIEASTGVRVHRFDGEDLRNDLDSVVGLAASLDLVITAPTAVSSLAGMAGVATWQIDAGNDWTAHGERRSPWIPTIELFSREHHDRDWSALMSRVRTALESWVSA
ncbi:MAG: hypothetical protein R2909_23910, partial [Gemmatimonadales bacterium]